MPSRTQVVATTSANTRRPIHRGVKTNRGIRAMPPPRIATVALQAGGAPEVDRDAGARDRGGLVRGQVGDERRHLVGLDEAGSLALRVPREQGPVVPLRVAAPVDACLALEHRGLD